ncbi:Transcriptional regulator lysR family protein [Enhygromyxa salina]|uniref:Transcriptional regulator lysR family protein n=1 Tax=Enhygromyxa salina TaxID=215803 RepID=A0A0C1ZCU6_9BACT|nr:LysR family transcriptional regulator [Enhygromyxa salina]KIG15529.1 Transcriptional regulator lysR family protein [Enhygromyxa salina]
MDELDWRWLRSFVFVAQADSMHAAAQRSGISQPTLSRHIKLLEANLGISLFERRGRGLTLSPQGQGLFERAVAVRDSVKTFEREALGLSEQQEGSVSVTMSGVFGIHFAPEWLSQLRIDEPHITIDLVIEDSAVNLLLREAEIAVRQFRPHQLELVTRLFGTTPLGLYASPQYVDQHGEPADMAELADFDLIGFDRETYWIEAAAAMGFAHTRDDFAIRCDASVVQVSMALAGLGIAAVPSWCATGLPLRRVLPEIVIPGPPLYLVAHPDLRRSPRVSRVWNHLAARLAALPLG